MSAKAGGAYGGATTTTGKERKTWDKEEYAQKAKEKDAEYAERAREREEAMKTGKKPRRREEMPKATKLLQARETPLELDKNVNKTFIVASGRPGFSCETCRRTLKDSASYLDHVNGRYHLRKIGQMTRVERSTLQQVQLKIQELRELSAKRMAAKQYDFESRLKELRDFEQESKKEKRDKKKRAKEAKEEQERKAEQGEVDPNMASMMGFAKFS